MIVDVRCYEQESLSQPRISQDGSLTPGPQNSGGRERRSAFFSFRSGQRSEVLTVPLFVCLGNGNVRGLLAGLC